MRITPRRAGLAVAGAGAALLATATPAFASGTFVQPSSNPYTVPVCGAAASSNSCDNPYSDENPGAPVAFPIQLSGLSPNTTYKIEICDGVSPSAQGWNPAADCDPASGATTHETDSSGNISWGTGNPNDEIGPFRGASPQGQFNCLAPQDNPNASTTQAGEPIQSGVKSYTNCQLRVAQSYVSKGADDAYITLSLQNNPTVQTPESPVAIALPVSAGVILVGGGAFIVRRRRSTAAA